MYEEGSYLGKGGVVHDLDFIHYVLSKYRLLHEFWKIQNLIWALLSAYLMIKMIATIARCGLYLFL